MEPLSKILNQRDPICILRFPIASDNLSLRVIRIRNLGLESPELSAGTPAWVDLSLMAMTGLALHGNQRKKSKQSSPLGQQTGFPLRTPASPKPYPSAVQLRELKSALVRTYADVQGHHT